MTLTRRRNRADTIGSLGDMEFLSSSGLYVPVGLTKATGKVPTVQADGTIGWQTPGNGASAGGILASYWSNATLTVNPDLSADTIITGMSATFTVAASTNVLMRVSVRASKNGYVVLSLYESGVKLAPLSGGGSAPPPNGWYLTTGNALERTNLQGTFEMGYTFATGTHTVDVYHAASANLNSVSFFERTLVITQL